MRQKYSTKITTKNGRSQSKFNIEQRRASNCGRNTTKIGNDLQLEKGEILIRVEWFDFKRTLSSKPNRTKGLFVTLNLEFAL